MTKSVEKKETNKELSDFINSKAAIQILKLFTARPESEMYQKEILDELKTIYNPKMTSPTLKKWLDFFVNKKLLLERKKKKWNLYRLNKGNPVVKQLKIFLNVTQIYEQIDDLAGEDAEIYLFGSAARGEDNEDSDIDLLVLGNIDDVARSSIKSSILKKLNRAVNFVIYSKTQYSDLYRNDIAFYENIERDKIKLL